jgi:hypothetical protein
MLKTEAIRTLGGTTTSAARAVGVSVSAVCQWPDVLPQAVVDRVQAALWRVAHGVPHPEPEKRGPRNTRRTEVQA